ncbi:hypothetical protein [Mycolicibacterium tokaiense]|uniref:Transmembrane protein n=1 Tax=Mycolicibacterium tokaiense TaxID=39695 RepID=A0A378TBT5_9MYCO|nr:hypothetical protein [Mycolicibacterium tokaiense]BBY87190.1 hypothetical protein MTOK_29720 [Mycolicibacterium tokaiense]STZ58292.1 Uncharacterised protein [Mycolicibacterium tokaiense]
MTPTSATPRPKAVDTAFWLLVAGAILLVINGLMATTLSFSASATDPRVANLLVFQRGAGILFVVVGAALGFVSGKMRQGDPRFRRATIAFAATITVLVLGLAVLAKAVFVVALLAVVPIIVGALALTRPPVVAWFIEQEAARG